MRVEVTSRECNRALPCRAKPCAALRRPAVKIGSGTGIRTPLLRSKDAGPTGRRSRNVWSRRRDSNPRSFLLPKQVPWPLGDTEIWLRVKESNLRPPDSESGTSTSVGLHGMMMPQRYMTARAPVNPLFHQFRQKAREASLSHRQHQRRPPSTSARCRTTPRRQRTRRRC